MRLLLCCLLVLMAFYWNACSCKTEASGVVLDALTKQPLEGVEVHIHLSLLHNDTLEKPVATNAIGHYELEHFYCSNYMIDFYKEGYTGFVCAPKLNDTILLYQNLETDDY